MNTHPHNASAKSVASTSTPNPDPVVENRHIEPAAGNNVNIASAVAIQNAASHVRDMLPPQNLAPQDGNAASAANPTFFSSETDASGNASNTGNTGKTNNRPLLPAGRVFDSVDIALPPLSDGRITLTQHDADTGRANVLVDVALPLIPPKMDIGKIGFKSGLKPAETFEKVLMMNKDQRPPVTEYLSEQYIQAHRQKFASGKGYCIMSTDASIERVQANGRIGRSSGNFVLPEEDFRILLAKVDAEKRSKNGDPQKMLETELGFWPGSLKGKELVSYEIRLKPEEVRIPDGRGEGSNELWRPGGMLPTGYTEAVVDPARLHNASKSLLVNGTTSDFTTRTRMDMVIKEPGNWTLYAGEERDLDAASNNQEQIGVLKVVIGSVCKTAIYLRLSSVDLDNYSANPESLKNFVREVQDNPAPFIARSVSVLARVMKEDQLDERKKNQTQRSDGVQARTHKTRNQTVFEADSVAVPVPEAKIDEIREDPTSVS